MRRSLLGALIGIVLALFASAAIGVGAEILLDRARLVHVARTAFEKRDFIRGLHPTQDTFSECALVTMEYLRHQNPLVDAIESWWIRPGPLTCDSLEVLLGMGPRAGAALPAPSLYYNYPFGTRYLMALVFTVADVGATRMIYRLLSYGSILVIFVAAFRSSPPVALGLLPVGLCLSFAFGLHHYGGNLLHSPGFLAGFMAVAALLLAPRWFADRANRFVLFGLLGGLTSYFEGMPGSIPVNVSMAILFNHFFYVRRRSEGDSGRAYWASALLEACAIAACFLVAFVTMTAVRLAILGALHQDLLRGFVSGVQARSGANVPGIGVVTFADAMGKLWSERAMMTAGGAGPASVLFVSATAAWVLGLAMMPFAWRRSRVVVTDVLAVVVAALAVVGWYRLFLNHTFIHAFFIVRIAALPAAYGFVVLLIVVRQVLWDRSWERKGRPMAETPERDTLTSVSAFWQRLDPRGLGIWRESTGQVRQLADQVWRETTLFVGATGVLLAGIFVLWTKESRPSDGAVLAALAILGIVVTVVAYRLIRTSRRRYVGALAHQILLENELGFYDVSAGDLDPSGHGMDKAHAERIVVDARKWQEDQLWEGDLGDIVRRGSWAAIALYGLMLALSLSGTYSTWRMTAVTESDVVPKSGKLVVAGEGTGLAAMGSTGCGGNFMGLALNGSNLGDCEKYNLLSSPSDPSLFINRPSRHSIQFREHNTTQMTLLTGGNVGIGTPAPAHPLQMGSGAHVTAGGVWTNASSRESKHDIRSLTGNEARRTLAALNPVKFAYNADPAERHVGFIAEDVPDLVASRERKTVSPMDIVAVLTRVIQEQQKTIARHERLVGELRSTVSRLEGVRIR